QVLARAGGLNLAAVQLDDVTHDGESQPHSGVLTRARAVSLTKTVEHVRQKLTCNADPGIHDPDPHVVTDLLELSVDATSRGCELKGVREQIPEHLLQPVRIAPHHGG